MNPVDGIFIIIVVLSCVISLFRGFIKEALSLATWVAAVLICYHFFEAVDAQLSLYIDNALASAGISIAILFIGTLLTGAIISMLVSQLVKVTGLSGTDRALGSVFGLLRGFIIIMFIVVLLDPYEEKLSTHDWWAESQLTGEVRAIVKGLRQIAT